MESPSATHTGPLPLSAAWLARCQARAHGTICACTLRTPGSTVAAAR
ncbi:MAG: hypothetical protein ACLQI7_13835 [Streptosporangiaceae bacterium]